MPSILEKTILIVDDDEIIVETLELCLEAEGYKNILTCLNGYGGLDIVDNNQISLIFLDLDLPDINGQMILGKINLNYPHIPIIIITGNHDLDSAINTLKNGAYDYLQKPFNLKRIASATKNALEFSELNYSFNNLKKEFFVPKLEVPKAFSSIITGNDNMIKLFYYISAISVTSFPVLITGETGVGKELFARSIHNKSGRSGEFVAMDVSSYNSESFKDTLFGHIKGAYTGASNNRYGLLKTAENGTLFLDEIGDLTLELQNILLRVLQESEYRQGGSDKVINTNSRVIFATNRNLHKLIEEGKFRKDLYYRLETHSFEIPPLRDRMDDIPLLFKHFISGANNQNYKVSNEIYSYLAKYNFPGNVRELKNIAINAVTLSQNSEINLKDVISKFKDSKEICENTSVFDQKISEISNDKIIINSPFPTIDEAITILIEEAMTRTHNNQLKASSLLGISRQALNKRLNKNRDIVLQ